MKNKIRRIYNKSKIWFLINEDKPYLYKNKHGKTICEQGSITQWFDEHPIFGVIKVILFWVALAYFLYPYVKTERPM